MAIKTGVTGSVTLFEGATAVDITKWSLSLNREILDISSWADANNVREKVGGMMDISGTFEGFLDDTNPLVIAQLELVDTLGATLTLTAVSSRTYVMTTAIMSNFNISSEKVGLPLLSASFVSSDIAIA